MISKEVKSILYRIIKAADKNEAINNVFYSGAGDPGIDRLYQAGKITAEEHEILFQIIKKLA